MSDAHPPSWQSQDFENASSSKKVDRVCPQLVIIGTRWSSASSPNVVPRRTGNSFTQGLFPRQQIYDFLSAVCPPNISSLKRFWRMITHLKLRRPIADSAESARDARITWHGRSATKEPHLRIVESSKNHQRIIGELSENHQRIIRELSENYQRIICYEGAPPAATLFRMFPKSHFHNLFQHHVRNQIS